MDVSGSSVRRVENLGLNVGYRPDQDIIWRVAKVWYVAETCLSGFGWSNQEKQT